VRLVRSRESRGGLHLHDHRRANDHTGAEAKRDADPLVLNWQDDFTVVWNPGSSQFQTKTFRINRIQKPRTKRPVNVDGETNDPFRQRTLFKPEELRESQWSFVCSVLILNNLSMRATIAISGNVWRVGPRLPW
jgi:hypothetical protein